MVWTNSFVSKDFIKFLPVLKKNTIISIILLLSCIIISLLLSNVPFIIKYFRNNNQIEGLETTSFDKINSIDELDALQKSIDDISLKNNEIDLLVKEKEKEYNNTSDYTSLTDKKFDVFADKVSKIFNLINTLVENIDIKEIQDNLSNILLKKPKPGIKDIEDYRSVVNKLDKELKSINTIITNKREEITKKLSEDTDKSMNKSKEVGNEVSSKNPLNSND